MKRIITLIIIALIAGVSYLYVENLRLNNKYKTSVENIKAYDSQLSGLKDNNRVLKLTVNQLTYFSDSIIRKMKEVQKDLGIKDKRLQQLQYQLSYGSRSDTLILRDTLFRDPELKIDTIMGDKWFKNRLQLIYPNHIYSSVSFTSEKFCFVQLKKETVNPPKKFFLARLFQKKHWVTIITVKENNPYVEVRDSRFIQIIDN